MNSSGDILSSYVAYFKHHVPMKPMALVKTASFAMTFLATNVIDGLLIATFLRHAVFRENARYVLFVHLVLNDLLELGVALTLFIWLDHQPFIFVPFCYVLLVLGETTTLNMPINLAVMALERYAAVCFPLRHAQMCSLRRTYLAIAAVWLIGVAPSAADLFVVFAVESPGFFRSSVFCIRAGMLKIPIQSRARFYLLSSYMSAVWLIFLFTYVRIALVARSASSSENSTAKKARNTILLHAGQLLLAMLNYLSPVFEQVFLSLPAHKRPDLNFIRYYLIFVVPRALSPVIYGLREENFRKHLRALFFQKQGQPLKGNS
ncbi:hypothetical protein AAFF_G00314900 [Aldrovandia affinis]|uniref:G-protein coupled receptors family 1 profile domain-containing protein n=1 Tax=Aldrovandia affinis TaxID=143900 RepID=A0AAD7R7L4_9TELE|nr:hypothetical protein AAFF_G00314900 [Aldrovandia affinis]